MFDITASAERAQDFPDLNMCPLSASCSADVALVELGSDSIGAGEAAALDFPDDGQDVGSKPLRIGL